MRIIADTEKQLFNISDIATELIVTERRVYFNSPEIKNATVDVRCVSHLYFSVAAKKLSALIIAGLLLLAVAAAAYFTLATALGEFHLFAVGGAGSLGALLMIVGIAKMQKRKGTLTIGVQGAEIKVPFEKIKESVLTDLRNAVFYAKDTYVA